MLIKAALLVVFLKNAKAVYEQDQCTRKQLERYFEVALTDHFALSKYYSRCSKRCEVQLHNATNAVARSSAAVATEEAKLEVARVHRGRHSELQAAIKDCSAAQSGLNELMSQQKRELKELRELESLIGWTIAQAKQAETLVATIKSHAKEVLTSVLEDIVFGAARLGN